MAVTPEYTVQIVSSDAEELMIIEKWFRENGTRYLLPWETKEDGKKARLKIVDLLFFIGENSYKISYEQNLKYLPKKPACPLTAQSTISPTQSNPAPAKGSPAPPKNVPAPAKNTTVPPQVKTKFDAKAYAKNGVS